MAHEIDEFIWEDLGLNIIDPNSTVEIGYKRKGRRGGFGKLCTGRKCLILRYGSDGNPIGELYLKHYLKGNRV
ncbi:hypothetical protein [Bacillus mobilis]|uniref:hypothetical protein n=1 Tax=Bacillus mobilis TaxID=2026190 RepID=UPI0022E64E75|nr:hypothetical protein [Bacillus mobilis]